MKNEMIMTEVDVRLATVEAARVAGIQVGCVMLAEAGFEYRVDDNAVCMWRHNGSGLPANFNGSFTFKYTEDELVSFEDSGDF